MPLPTSCSRSTCRRWRQAGAAHAAPVGPGPEPLAFTIDKPARISLDLPNTTLALPSRRIDVGAGRHRHRAGRRGQWPLAHRAEPGSAAALQTRVQGNDIIVLVGAAGRTRAAAPADAPARWRPRRGGRAHDPQHRFPSQRDRRRAAWSCELSDPRTPIEPEAAGLADLGRLRRHRSAASKLTRRYDTLDFGTPVTGFDVERINGNDTRIVLNAHRRLRAARLPVRRPVRGRDAAAEAQGRGRRPADEKRVQGREA